MSEAAARPVRGRRRPSPLPSPVLLAVIAGAWLLAVAAEATGRAGWVHHHDLVQGALPLWAALAVFLLAWQVHVAAMMLPSSLPLFALFRRASRDQPRRHVVRAAFLAGYVAVWTGFGALAFGGDVAVHRLVDVVGALDRPHLIGGSVLLVAGAFQFTDLKDRCLQQCRHPAVFLLAHYRRGTAAAWRLGLRHGLFCLGCCWALMLVMFALGIANLAWMAPFTLLMVHEKTGAGGDRHTRPIGLALIVLGVLVAVDPAWMPPLFAHR